MVRFKVLSSTQINDQRRRRMSWRQERFLRMLRVKSEVALLKQSQTPDHQTRGSEFSVTNCCNVIQGRCVPLRGHETAYIIVGINAGRFLETQIYGGRIQVY